MRSIVAILSIFLFVGCNINRTSKVLADVESYISDRPDSALCVLESLDSDMLNTRRLRAHHALLHAMALDKNYIDVTDDSLANVAVNYYQKHGKKKYLARSLYYKALAHYYAKDYEVAIVDATRAENIARESDSLYLGFTKVLQANIHDKNYNSMEELKALQSALSVYTDIAHTYYINVAKMLLGRSYINNDRYEDAELLLSDLISSAQLNRNVRVNSMREYAFLLATRPTPNFQVSVQLYDEVVAEYEELMSINDYWAFSYSLSKLGRYDESKDMIDQLLQIDSSGTASYWLYRIEKDKGNADKALKFLEDSVNKDNEEVTEVLKQSISTIQRDFYEAQYDMQIQISENRMLLIVCIILASLLIVLLFVVIIMRYINKLAIEKERYIQYAETMTQKLKEYSNYNYTSLQKKFLTTYKSRYETLGVLFDQYTQVSGRVDAEKIVYKKVVSLIDELRKEIGDVDSLVRMLDEDLNGIMTTFHEEFPDIKTKDYLLFGFFALGFDATVISHFMDTTVNTVYIRKSRLKKQIEESSAEHKSQFLELMS